jgi:hypothetical protein
MKKIFTLLFLLVLFLSGNAQIENLKIGYEEFPTYITGHLLLMETTKVGDKYSGLFVYFSTHLVQWHKARIKFFVLLITALCKMQTVCFERLAEGMDSNAQINSCLRRIQRFFAQFTIDNNKVASVLFSLLPCKTSLVISIDRTNWPRLLAGEKQTSTYLC